MFSHLIRNIKAPDHPKYSDAVIERAKRIWSIRQRRQLAEAQDAAYNAWFHDGVIMQRDMFGNWGVKEQDAR